MILKTFLFDKTGLYPLHNTRDKTQRSLEHNCQMLKYANDAQPQTKNDIRPKKLKSQHTCLNGNGIV